MAINSVSGGASNLPVLRPEPQRNKQSVQSTEQLTARQTAEKTREGRRTEEKVTDSKLDTRRFNETSGERQQLNESLRTTSPESNNSLNSNNTRENREVFTRTAERESDKNEVTGNFRVDRNDQARDALKARFEENSRPKPEPAFEVRA